MTAATYAPSCFNNQSWRFMVVTNDEALTKVHGALSSGNYWVKKAPVIVVVATKPDLDCDGTLSWEDVEPGANVTGTFTVENIGEDGSLLDWEIESYPDWGTWTFYPDGGTDLPKGAPVTVIVEVVAPEDPETEFEGEVKLVNSEDPDDFCIIDAALATPVSQQSLISLFFEKLAERFPFLASVLEMIF